MVHSRPTLPQGHGEVFMRPDFGDWANMAENNASTAGSWRFPVLGEDVSHFRDRARREAIEKSIEFSRRMGVELVEQGALSRVVMTGHQPELYHPGVWVKNFALQRLAEETGALAIDLVVDTDGFDEVSLSAPCLSPVARRCTRRLAAGVPGGCYACTAVPAGPEIEAFIADVDAMLATLPAPALRRHFADFAEALRASADRAGNLAELITFARRRYEVVARTTYLELPVTQMADTETFRQFALDVAARGREFAEIYNAELDAYRAGSGIRSPAQPFPNLRMRDDAVELPFWLLSGDGRRGAWAHPGLNGILIGTSEGTVLPPDSSGSIPPGVTLVPRALTLTMYARMFLSDLFIHGVGGGRYDRVTDGVARRFYEVEPPGFAVASMTMYLPLGGHAPDAAEIEDVRRRMSRLEHNPDSMLGEVDFEDADERDRAASLAAEKAGLVDAISSPGADKKALGSRIRELNDELAGFLGPYADELRRELDSLEAQRSSAEILTDRTYPFCLWSPLEIADKVR